MDTDPLAPADLLALALEPGWVDADPANRFLIRVDLNETQALSAANLATVRQRLASLPVPIIGFGDGGGSPLQDVVDLVVGTDDEFERVVHTVHAQPMASAILVQVLRMTCALGLVEALTVESLAYATLQAGPEFAAWLRGRPAKRPRPMVEGVVLLRRAGDCLEIVLNDPDSRNALSVSMRDALTDAFKLVAMDRNIVRVDVSGRGPCFSSGGDLREFGTVANSAEAHQVRLLRMPARYLAERAERYTFRVHGACIGAGIELPAFAGRLTATADAFFQLPEVAMGLIPGAGGCVSIPRRIGRQRTAYMALLGDRIPAQQALAWGLIDTIEN